MKGLVSFLMLVRKGVRASACGASPLSFGLGREHSARVCDLGLGIIVGRARYTRTKLDLKLILKMVRGGHWRRSG